MRPRFLGRVGLADAVTVANAALGFVAILVAFVDVEWAARLVLLAAILDGLDGVVARWRGGTKVGPYLDSLADVSSFAVAPAVLAFVVIADGLGVDVAADFPTSAEEVALELAVAAVVCAAFVAMAVTRLGLYTAYDAADEYTEGVQTTLAATLLGAAVLAAVTDPYLILGGMALFSYLMVSTIRYPDLLARDAMIMGVVHVLAVLIPYWQGRAFPWALLTLAVGYLLLGPWLYWRKGTILPAAVWKRLGRS